MAAADHRVIRSLSRFRIADTAFAAGVQRLIPADFGSDSASPWAQKHLKILRDKTVVRRKCEELARERGGTLSLASPGPPLSRVGSSSTTVFMRLTSTLTSRQGRPTSWTGGGGSIRAATSTLARTAQAVIAVLQRPDATRNRIVYVQSFCPTQLEVLEAVERATGQTWSRERFDSETFLPSTQQKLEAED
ncbi:hypothetical protein CDD83_11189 [Cordyceps sp. RAO-2017]|nr:hypothetical protein CDD83_11189 [Cordyceps sp. RAO-2017]